MSDDFRGAATESANYLSFIAKYQEKYAHNQPLALAFHISR